MLAAGGATAGVELLSSFGIVAEPGSLDHSFAVGLFADPNTIEDSFSVAIIAGVGAKLLVAFPAEAWDKKVKDRKLPAGTLEKPLYVRVAGCAAEDRSLAVEDCFVNVWLGWLKSGFSQHISFDISASAASFDFVDRETGEPCYPLAEALVEAAVEKYNLTDLLQAPSSDARLAQLESRFVTLEAGLNELLASHRGSPGEGGFVTADEPPLHPAASTKPARHSRAQEKLMGPPGLSPPTLAGIDPSVVAAAIQAGIPHDQLRAMSRVLAAKPKRLEDYPRPAQEPMEGESESEEAIDPGDAAPDLVAQKDPMADAVLKLTNIVTKLSKKKVDSMDDVFTGVSIGESGSADSSSTLGRKHAAAREALKRAFRNTPEKIWKIIETNMEEDFHLQASRPNSGNMAFSARGWAEYRSKIMPYPRTVRAAWGVAGILNSLRANDVNAARARACLMLAQFEQESLDHGSFLLAQEFAMEPPAPLSSFQQHVLPDVMEMSTTKLINQQWIEAFADRLKQVDSYMEMRRKLNVRKAPTDPETKTYFGKGKGAGQKGAGKQKKGDKSQRGEEQAEASTAAR